MSVGAPIEGRVYCAGTTLTVRVITLLPGESGSPSARRWPTWGT